MTNYESIIHMSVDELAEWLSDIFDCSDCTEYQRLSDNPLLTNERCDGKCDYHCKEWLNKEKWWILIKQLSAKIDGRGMEDNLEIRWMRRLKRLKWQYKMIEERYKLRD